MMERLQDLNFLHLYYFWIVARDGTISAACERLNLTQPTISTQIQKLEKSLGQKLFERNGRKLHLTDLGQTVFEYADDMFSIGRELIATLRGTPSGRTSRLYVGVSMIMPKLITYRLLQPVLRMPQSVQIVCREAELDKLATELARHRFDVILSDAPIPSQVRVRSFNHLLGDCGVAVCAVRELAMKYRRRFPESLDGAPFLLPTPNTEMRRSLDRWFDTQGISPDIVAEFDDSALLKEFGHGGNGLFPIPSAVLPEVKRQYKVELVGHLTAVRSRFYAITMERKLTHPAVVAISNSARLDLLVEEAAESA